MAELYHAYHKYIDRYVGKNGKWVYVYNDENGRERVGVGKKDYNHKQLTQKNNGKENTDLGIYYFGPDKPSPGLKAQQKLNRYNDNLYNVKKVGKSKISKDLDNEVRSENAKLQTVNNIVGKGQTNEKMVKQQYRKIEDSVEKTLENRKNKLPKKMSSKERNAAANYHDNLENIKSYARDAGLDTSFNYEYDRHDKELDEHFDKMRSADERKKQNRKSFRREQQRQIENKRYEEARGTYGVHPGGVYYHGYDPKTSRVTKSTRIASVSNNGKRIKQTHDVNIKDGNKAQIKVRHMNAYKRETHLGDNPSSDPKKWAEEQRAKKRYEEARYHTVQRKR